MRTLKIENVGKLIRYVVIGSIIGSACYIFLFFYVYKGNIENFIKYISLSSIHFLILAFLLRALVITVHGSAWYVLIKALRKVRISDVLKVTYTAVFTEFIIPIGGITEVVKVMLLTKLKLANTDESIAALFAHRIVLSLSLMITTFISLVMINSPLILYLLLLGPTLVLIAMNIGGFIAPSSSKVESLVNRFTAGLGYNIKGFSNKYFLCIKNLINRPQYLIASLGVEILERLTNALFGMSVGYMIGIKLNIFQALLAFDALYAIMWLFPVITPGGLGIFETIQTTLLHYLGIGLTQAATASIIARIAYICVGYPLFAISAFLLGFHIKDLVKLNMQRT